MHRVRNFGGITRFQISRVQFLSSNQPSKNSFGEMWKAAKPKLEATKTEVSNNAERVFSSLKGSVLEMMARRMPDDTRVFLANRWGFLSEKDNTKNLLDNTVNSEPTNNSKVHHATESTIDNGASNSVAQAEVADVPIDEVHPVLGKLVCDLEYKKVYVTNIRGLVQAPVWERQRILRPHRSQKIATAKAKQGGSLSGLPGVITMFQDRETGKIGIVDGQHRAGALMLMAQSGAWQDDHMNILVDVYTTDSDKGIAVLFTEINSAEPVRQIDMPEENVDTDVREVLTEGTDILMNQYKEMFKPSARCRIPHIHADSFRDELYQTDFVKRHNIKTTDELLKKLSEINDKLGNRDLVDWTAGGSPSTSFANAHAKAVTNKFYLGLSKNWMLEE